jgi:tetratricopeptide (TPR) repeat protein
LGGRFSYRAYAGATHELVPMSFGDGLQFIFEPLSPSHLAIQHINYATVDSLALNDALRSSDSTYAIAARSLGLGELLPEDVLNDLGYALLDGGNVALAILVFKRNARHYPQSPNVYDSLGDAYLAAADTGAAIEEYRRAVGVAHAAGVGVDPETQRKLDALKPGT